MHSPPWDIHMELPYGTMGDDEIRQLNIPALQEDGYFFPVGDRSCHGAGERVPDTLEL